MSVAALTLAVMRSFSHGFAGQNLGCEKSCLIEHAEVVLCLTFTSPIVSYIEH